MNTQLLFEYTQFCERMATISPSLTVSIMPHVISSINQKMHGENNQKRNVQDVQFIISFQSTYAFDSIGLSKIGGCKYSLMTIIHDDQRGAYSDGHICKLVFEYLSSKINLKDFPGFEIPVFK